MAPDQTRSLKGENGNFGAGNIKVFLVMNQHEKQGVNCDDMTLRKNNQIIIEN